MATWYDEYLKDNPTTCNNNWINWRNDFGHFHREDGPAVIWRDASKQWWKNGKIHRDNGPALIYPSKRNKWYINDLDITEKVKNWIKDHNYPEWIDESSWDDVIKIHFKFTFVE